MFRCCRPSISTFLVLLVAASACTGDSMTTAGGSATTSDGSGGNSASSTSGAESSGGPTSASASGSSSDGTTATSPTSGGSGGFTCDGTLATIQADIFAPRCGNAGCHAATQPQASLDLVSPGVDARLVGVPAATCDGWLRVAPGDPAASLLHAKLAGPVPCGAPMPIGAPLDPAEIDCIDTWIEVAQMNCESCGGPACIDLDTDPAHCGTCDKPCPGGVACVGGQCTCPGGQTLCGDTCVDTDVDPDNCGGCGMPCKANEVCAGGACSASCGNQTPCDGGCVDTMTDDANCGGCGVTCDPGKTCIAGQCECGAAVSFAGTIQPIFTANCATMGCHAGPAPAEGLKLAAGSSYASLVNVASSQCANRKRVLPGQPAASYLIDKVNGTNLCFGTQMPKGAKLSQAELDTLAVWVCNGAPNN